MKCRGRLETDPVVGRRRTHHGLTLDGLGTSFQGLGRPSGGPVLGSGCAGALLVKQLVLGSSHIFAGLRRTLASKRETGIT